MNSKYHFLTPICVLTAMANSFGQTTITVPPKKQTASLFADVTFRVTATSTQALGTLIQPQRTLKWNQLSPRNVQTHAN